MTHFTKIAVLFFLLTGCQENKITPIIYGALTGEVILETGGLPVEGATISTNPATSALLSNFNGTFEFEKH